jgi:hypothetical protein
VACPPSDQLLPEGLTLLMCPLMIHRALNVDEVKKVSMAAAGLCQWAVTAGSHLLSLQVWDA